MKKLVNKAKNTLKGAKETVVNYNQVRKNNKQSRANLDSLAISKAKKIYKAETGREMTASMLKAELTGGFPTAQTKKYMNDKKVIRKGLKTRFGL